MPSTKSSNHWTLSELLGQRKLLGFGALLAWLVLFHLLVNVWLLCIFTSLLVVLGGWLGSRAILDANSLLHLEHFLPLGSVNPPLHSPEHEWRLNHEIHSAVHKAVRDFVSSWYRTLLPEVEGEFEHVVCNSLLESVMELKERARIVDRKALVQGLLELYGCHLQSYMTARHLQSTQKENISLWQLYSEVDSPHPAVSSAAAELSYTRALVNLVLHVLVPYPEMETRTGSYVVTELITCNVLLPLISRVSDPDWLNQTIVDIFTRSQEAEEVSVDELPLAALYRCQVQQESWTTCRSLASSEQACMVSLMSAEKIENCHTGLLTPCKVNCCSLTSGHYTHSPESKIMSLDSLVRLDSEDDLTGGFCDCGPPTKFCNVITLKDDEEAFGCFGPLKNVGPKVVAPEDFHWPTGIAQDKSPPCPPRRLSPASYNFDTTNNMTAPVNIQNIHISGTVTSKEQRGAGTHPYTLYTVKFESKTEAENGATPQPAACHTVNRRYSEFLNLQSRLEENPEVKKLIKNVKGPKKLFPDLPFGNADSEKVEARKSQLDMFLKQLGSIPETANSEDMQEFLVLNSDVCTYFGRKPFGKSRIDKVKKDLHVDSMYMYIRRRCGRSVIRNISPYVLNGMSLSGLERFVKEQERLLCEKNGREVSTQSCEQPGKDKKTSGKTHGTDTAVADVALNILCLLMKDQWSWLCTENIQKTIRLLFGTFIERWLDVGVAHLTSGPCWVIYLQVLQETVWPGGTLPAQPRPERSAAEREETKEQCLDCLMRLLPELITDMLDSEKYRLSVGMMLESLQDYQINK
uniref:Sorting nexin 19a n=1 Tax=Mastacembelus armatus TaxID=205130 RepID=A0A3Q3MEV3_9TELE